MQVVEATNHFPAFVVFERGKYTMAEWLLHAQPDLMQQKLLLHEVPLCPCMPFYLAAAVNMVHSYCRRSSSAI